MSIYGPFFSEGKERLGWEGLEPATNTWLVSRYHFLIMVAATLYALVGQKRSCLGKNLSFEMQGIAYCKQHRCIFNFSHEAIHCKRRNFIGNNCTMYAGLHKGDDHCGRRHAAKWV